MRVLSITISIIILFSLVDYIVFVQSSKPVPLAVNTEEVEAIKYITPSELESFIATEVCIILMSIHYYLLPARFSLV